MKPETYLTLSVLLAAVSNTAIAQNAGRRNDIHVYSDSTIVNYIAGGRVEDGKLYLIADNAYDKLTQKEKSILIHSLTDSLTTDNIVVNTETEIELWTRSDTSAFQLTFTWDADNSNIEKYKPLSIQKSGLDRMFWYAGGNIHGTKGNFNGSINLRIGTYLYKNYVDCSITSDLGLMSASGSTSFSGNIGIMGRGSFPIPIPKVPIAPYGGIGINLNLSPQVYFEIVTYTGISLYIGPGSIDIGFQYGLKSKFSATFGYTFRPQFSKRKTK